MATFNYAPDQSAKKSIKPKVKKFQFLDGYEQRLVDGLHSILEEWSCTFKRDPATVTAIDTFLKARGAVESFRWTTPMGRNAVFVCDEWDINYDSVGWNTVTAVFREVPENAAA